MRFSRHGQHRDGEDHEVPRLHSGHEQHDPAGEDEGEGGAQVRLDEDEEAEPAQEEEGREQRLELVHPVAAPLDVVGEKEHEGELGQLRGLEAEGPEADPAVSVVHRVQEEHRDEAQRGRRDEGVDDAGPAQRPVVEAEGRHHGREADDAPHRLPHQEVVGAAVALLGQGRARAPHHEQAEAQQGHGDGEEGEVGGQLPSHRLPSRRPRPGVAPRP
jgi:hypothetical protein